MNVFSHGGDLKSLAEEACRPERDILDFSVNLRPEGMPEFIVSALWKAMENAVPYPSPDAADLRELAAVHYGLPSGCFVFGNGANELIHALPRALNLKQAVIPEPAFSEYRLACLRHGTDVLSIRTEERNSFLPSLCRLEEQAADGSAVFLANPSNPSGGLLDAAALHRVVQSRPEVLWIIDESFYQKTYVQNQVMGRVLAESILLLDGKCIIGYLKKRDMEFYGVDGKDLDGIVSQLRLTAGVEVAMFIYEVETQSFKVSLRSNGNVDVSKIAVYFGGGGHMRAAGCDLQGSVYDVINNVTEQICKQFQEQEV